MLGFRAWAVLGAVASLIGCAAPPQGTPTDATATPARDPLPPGFPYNAPPPYSAPGRTPLQAPSRPADAESVRRYMDSMNERLERARAGGGQAAIPAPAYIPHPASGPRHVAPSASAPRPHAGSHAPARPRTPPHAGGSPRPPAAASAPRAHPSSPRPATPAAAPRSSGQAPAPRGTPPRRPG